MADPASSQQATGTSGGLIRRPRTGREILKKFFLRAIATIVLATAVVYICDYLILRFRVATNGQPFDTVTVHPYYAVPQKDQKTEFLLGDPTDQQCVNSLFPHMGDSPCWYLTRHTDQRVDM
jgi:hypothetical protein